MNICDISFVSPTDIVSVSTVLHAESDVLFHSISTVASKSSGLSPVSNMVITLADLDVYLNSPPNGFDAKEVLSFIIRLLGEILPV